MMDRESRFYKDEAEFYRNKIEFAEKYYHSPQKVGLRSKIKAIWHKWSMDRIKKEAEKREKDLRKKLSVPFEGLNRDERDVKIIVSLTSFPARIDCVAPVVGGMLRQSMQADKICVYLGKKQFEKHPIPKDLKTLADMGLVELCFREDLKPHTKYFYAMQEHPNDIVITVDDDIIYRPTLIEELYKSFVRFPECVSCVRAHKMRFDRDGKLLPYWDWIHEYHYTESIPTHRLLATGVGGVLYPPHCFSEEAFDVETIKKTCLSADDLWLKIMEIRHGRKVVLCADSSIPQEVLGSAQTVSLLATNLQDKNDRQMEAILEHFGMNLVEYMDDEI
ncbi:MAG: glycosyltransferase family 2 protein [Christensenellaceae bacterium]